MVSVAPSLNVEKPESLGQTLRKQEGMTVAMWRMVLVLIVLMAGSTGTAAAQGKPGKPGGGPGSGETCPTGTAQVVLDPGHGGSDPGATVVHNGTTYREANFNLVIASIARDILVTEGYTVALTRYDNDTYLENSQRGAIANACGADVFVEIHLNGSSDPAANYTSNFYGKKNKDLAFSQTMNGALNSLCIPNNGVGQFANGGLLHAGMPSTLVEAVFLTNNVERGYGCGTWSETSALVDGGRTGEIASAVADGIMDFVAPR